MNLPDRLHVHGNALHCGDGEPGTLIAWVFANYSRELAPADLDATQKALAARLAACWNFCHGFDTDTLIAGPQMEELVGDYSGGATKDLLAACKAALSKLERTPLDKVSVAADMLREAIARAEGRETP